ncbi:MAG: hypothetical protein ACP5TH_00025 [Fervidicoccaceae archaeon]
MEREWVVRWNAHTSVFFSLALAIAVISALALTLISLYITLFQQDVWGIH